MPSQTLPAGFVIHVHGVPARLLADTAVESETDLQNESLLSQSAPFCDIPEAAQSPCSLATNNKSS